MGSEQNARDICGYRLLAKNVATSYDIVICAQQRAQQIQQKRRAKSSKKHFCHSLKLKHTYSIKVITTTNKSNKHKTRKRNEKQRKGECQSQNFI